MNYAKPEFVLTASAVGVIQGSTVKGSPFMLHANGRDFNATSTAYEADE